MKLLIITGPLWPRIGNNANLLTKLLPFLSRVHEIEILTPVLDQPADSLPDQMFGFPVHWVTPGEHPIKDFQNRVLSRRANNRGYTGEYGVRTVADAAVALRKTFRYDAVLCTMQPYVCAAAASRIPHVPKVIYLMDPPDYLVGGNAWKRSEEYLMDSLEKMEVIITTPFIKQAAMEHGLSDLTSKMETAGFPHITRNLNQACELDISFDPSKINLLFCGALFPSVRDPSCFLRIVERLDERYTITFMGRNCEKFWNQHAVQSKAQIRVFPPQPYQIAVNAMLNADVLINIGNNMGVHMPSKTLDYINTGNPIVNFHKFIDCPTLYYTNRYPLCLNLYEKDLDMDNAFQIFTSFCETKKDKQVPREQIERAYPDCKPDTISEIILNAIAREVNT